MSQFESTATLLGISSVLAKHCSVSFPGHIRSCFNAPCLGMGLFNGQNTLPHCKFSPIPILRFSVLHTNLGMGLTIVTDFVSAHLVFCDLSLAGFWQGTWLPVSVGPPLSIS